ncbi:hypothetical protein QVD17_28991 [Tagetes erecta]|uniref:Uncharacterized protein n=1 Tax=Tagetes erecta TaxID=13708 RepID=A0AAD8KFW7_TARER|nr:hypothetical protein QVD17_28991 [Tagetes erecta]
MSKQIVDGCDHVAKDSLSIWVDLVLRRRAKKQELRNQDFFQICDIYRSVIELHDYGDNEEEMTICIAMLMMEKK